jgi:hypothetical protein
MPVWTLVGRRRDGRRKRGVVGFHQLGSKANHHVKPQGLDHSPNNRAARFNLGIAATARMYLALIT